MPMTPHFVLNPAFQIIAAYIIFIAGFLVLFLLAMLSIAVVCIVYRFANQLAIYLWQSQHSPPVREAKQTIALTPHPSHD
jgi:hypothetical protein